MGSLWNLQSSRCFFSRFRVLFLKLMICFISPILIFFKLRCLSRSFPIKWTSIWHQLVHLRFLKPNPSKHAYCKHSSILKHLFHGYCKLDLILTIEKKSSNICQLPRRLRPWAAHRWAWAARGTWRPWTRRCPNVLLLFWVFTCLVRF